MPLLRVQAVAEPVTQQVHAEHDEHDCQAGEERYPPTVGRGDEDAAIGDHETPRWLWRRDAGAQKTESALCGRHQKTRAARPWGLVHRRGHFQTPSGHSSRNGFGRGTTAICGFTQCLVIFAESALQVQPTEGPFHDPPAGQHLEGLLPGGTAH